MISFRMFLCHSKSYCLCSAVSKKCFFKPQEIFWFRKYPRKIEKSKENSQNTILTQVIFLLIPINTLYIFRNYKCIRLKLWMQETANMPVNLFPLLKHTEKKKKNRINQVVQKENKTLEYQNKGGLHVCFQEKINAVLPQ